jgi:hypothetical protein
MYAVNLIEKLKQSFLRGGWLTFDDLDLQHYKLNSKTRKYFKY